MSKTGYVYDDDMLRDVHSCSMIISEIKDHFLTLLILNQINLKLFIRGNKA